MLRPRAFASVFFAALMIIGTIQSARAQTVPLTASSPEPTPAANATPAPHRDGLAIAFAGAVVAFLLVEVVHCSTKAGGCGGSCGCSNDCANTPGPDFDDARSRRVSIAIRLPISIHI